MATADASSQKKPPRQGRQLTYVAEALDRCEPLTAERTNNLSTLRAMPISQALSQPTPQAIPVPDIAAVMDFERGGNEAIPEVELVTRPATTTYLYELLKKFANAKLPATAPSFDPTARFNLAKRRSTPERISKGKEPEGPGSGLATGVAAAASVSANTKNLIFLTGCNGVGKSFAMRELALRLINRKESNVRVVYIGDCEAWGSKARMEDKITYLLMALRLAFSADDDFGTIFDSLEDSTVGTADAISFQILKAVAKYCKEHADKSRTPLRVVFFLDNLAAAYPSDASGTRDIERIVKNILMSNDYFFSVVATSNNDPISGLDADNKVPTWFSEEEAEALVSYKWRQLGYVSDETDLMAKQVLWVVKQYTDFHPQDMSLLLGILNEEHEGAGPLELTREYLALVASTALAFEQTNDTGLNSQLRNTYIDPVTEKLDEASTLSIFQVHHCIPSTAPFVHTNGDSKRSLENHPYITHIAGRETGRQYVFSSPRKGNFVFKQMLGTNSKLFKKISKLVGGSDLERNQFAFAAALWLIRNGRFEEVEGHSTKSFDRRPLNLRNQTQAVHLGDKLPEAYSEINDAIGIPQLYAMEALAFHGEAMRKESLNELNGLDFIIHCHQNKLIGIATAMVRQGTQIMEIIRDYKRLKPKDGNATNGGTVPDNITTTERVAYALMEFERMKEKLGSFEFEMVLLTSDSAYTSDDVKNEFRNGYIMLGNVRLSLININNIEKLRHRSINHFLGKEVHPKSLERTLGKNLPPIAAHHIPPPIDGSLGVLAPFELSSSNSHTALFPVAPCHTRLPAGEQAFLTKKSPWARARGRPRSSELTVKLGIVQCWRIGYCGSLACAPHSACLPRTNNRSSSHLDYYSSNSAPHSQAAPSDSYSAHQSNAGYSLSPREYLHTPVHAPIHASSSPSPYSQNMHNSTNYNGGAYGEDHSYAPTVNGRDADSPTMEYYNRGYDRYANQPESQQHLRGYADDSEHASPYYSPTPATVGGGAGGYSDKPVAGSYLDQALVGAAAEKSPAMRRRRQCCGNGYFCCFSRRCCCIFIPILVLILIGLGITLYFVWPRIPQVTFTGVTVPNTGKSSAVAKDNPVAQLVGNTSIDRKGVVTVPLVIHLNVTNPNYIPWTIHNVTVDGFIKNTTQGGDNFPVGAGGLKEPFSMPKKSVGNDMPIWFNFRLDTNNTNYLDAAQIVQQACTAGGPNLRFYYKAKVILKAISWLGIKPTISDSVSFACPISDINALGININDLTGLASTASSALGSAANSGTTPT
ncbi:hypothetical protein GQ54DRAFT_301104 [Martensiomyces pterosporus]|nr:hypothetical protein GQ54DRAFT_301104 [Martensiomyces pterosporus]